MSPNTSIYKFGVYVPKYVYNAKASAWVDSFYCDNAVLRCSVNDAKNHA